MRLRVKPHIVCLLILGLFLVFLVGHGQTKNNSATTIGVSYRVVSQRWLSKSETSEALKGNAVFNMAVRLRLSNESNRRVYYLAFSDDNIFPLGYHFSRKVGGKDWEMITPPTRGRAGLPGTEFKGGAYRYLILDPGTSVEFEAGDLTAPDVERAFSVILKTDQSADPVEVFSDVYRPLTNH